jgi:hypothetical protein
LSNTYLLIPRSRVLLDKLTGFAANQEIPHILWNLKVHYRTHKHLPHICQILEKKWEYKEAVQQLFIEFKKAYDSVRREVLYNILMEFGIPLKLVRLKYMSE